jgi:hypothetical protein
MLFERGHDLPTATVRALPPAHDHGLLLGELLAWLDARWRFVRPRLIPIACAALGAFATIASMRALTPEKQAFTCRDKLLQIADRVDGAPAANAEAPLLACEGPAGSEEPIATATHWRLLD